MTETLTLGIETSCDETAASVVARSGPARGRILSNIVRSQWAEHEAFGGVVPEIAARAHVICLDDVIKAALCEAGVALDDLDAIAVTAGPGLIGGLIVGVTTAQALALAADLPLIGVNHLEAHALTVGLTDGLAPPYLLLLVSGGHTQILLTEKIGRYQRLATTIDDALGEAFDKTAKLLGLGLPGGPKLEQLAADGDATRLPLPRPMLGRQEPHFSFAGLKTAVRKTAHSLAPLSAADKADLAASFQAAVCDCVGDRLERVIALIADKQGHPEVQALVAAGGVAANIALRRRLEEIADANGLSFTVPPIGLCSDNAAMVAWAGAERLALGGDIDMSVEARARWPLDAHAAPILGTGRLGAKA